MDTTAQVYNIMDSDDEDGIEDMRNDVEELGEANDNMMARMGKRKTKGAKRSRAKGSAKSSANPKAGKVAHRQQFEAENVYELKPGVLMRHLLFSAIHVQVTSGLGKCGFVLVLQKHLAGQAAFGVGPIESEKGFALELHWKVSDFSIAGSSAFYQKLTNEQDRDHVDFINTVKGRSGMGYSELADIFNRDRVADSQQFNIVLKLSEPVDTIPSHWRRVNYPTNGCLSYIPLALAEKTEVASTWMESVPLLVAAPAPAPAPVAGVAPNPDHVQ